MSRSARDGARSRARREGGTLAFVESPVQLLNVLEWAHSAAVISAGVSPREAAAEPAEAAATEGSATEVAAAEGAVAEPWGGAADDGRCSLTVVVLSPHDPMTRGQLRRVAELARDEGVHVRWEDARGGPTAPLKTVGSLVRELRRARRVVIGDPFSRYVQLLLTLTTARDVVVVDDGTATMEFVSQLAGGERLVRWHRKGSAPAGPHAAAQAVLFAPFARLARARLTPGSTGRTGAGTDGNAGGTAGNAGGTDGNAGGTAGNAGGMDGSRGGARGGDGDGPRGGHPAGSGEGFGGGTGGERDRRVEIFSSMPVDASDSRLREMGVAVTANDFAWTRSRFGPPRLTRGTDLVGTSLVETGVVDLERYLEGVAALARTHGATRYFAHRRESSEKLHRVKSATGLEIVRPDLPLELVARRGPIGRTVVSFPSTVVHTLPLALAGTPVSVAVCEVDRTWFTPAASPRAEGFLSGVTDSARRVRRLGGTEVPGTADAVTAAGTATGHGPGTDGPGTDGPRAAGNGTTAPGQSAPEPAGPPEPRPQRPSRTPCHKEAGRASA